MTRARVVRVAIALVVLIGAILAFALFAARPKDALTVVAVRQDVVESAVASGRVVAPSRIEVGVVTGGVVAEVLVSAGQHVATGDLLLRLDDRMEAAAVAQARAGMSQAKARMLEVTEVQRARAAAALAAAEAELQRAQSQAERTRRLAAGGASTAVEAEVTETALALALAKRDGAAVDVRANQADGAQVRLAEAQLEAARASLQVAEARLSQTRVVALVDATVLRRDVEPGDAAFPGRTLLALARTDNAAGGQLEIIVEPDEKSLAVLKPGQSAACAADAYAGERFAAVVKEISPLVDADRGTIEVRLAVPRPPAFLRTDMTVSVEITTGKKENALVVPLDVVRDLATRAPFVLVLDDHGTAAKAAVQLGARGADVVEILDGLADGAVVVKDPRIKAGVRVRAP